MIKELLKLVQLLFKSRPSDVIKLPDLEVIYMRHFPFTGYRYMMWCGKVICRPEEGDVMKRFFSMIAGQRSKTHEYGHVLQAESEHGDNWLRYYLSYLWHWFRHNPFAPSAYYFNRYEVEAYAQDENPDYWIDYSRDNLRGKYNIKHARKIFREQCNCSIYEWKKYIKTL